MRGGEPMNWQEKFAYGNLHPQIRFAEEQKKVKLAKEKLKNAYNTKVANMKTVETDLKKLQKIDKEMENLMKIFNDSKNKSYIIF